MVRVLLLSTDANERYLARTIAAEDTRRCAHVAISLYELNLLELSPVKTPSHVYIKVFH